MNTTGLYNFSAQTNWLQAQLNLSALDANTDFVFEYNHQPGHSEIWPDGNMAYVEDNIYPLEANYPKMVMSAHGHSHNYERGTIRGTHASNWDFREVLCGGAGGALDRWGMYSNQTDYPEIQKSLDHFCFVLVDVGMGSKKIFTTTYSLGHSDKPRNLEPMDRWHRFLNQPAPDKPDAIWPEFYATTTPTLQASPFSGQDTLMSSEFQLVSIGGSFSSPLVDVVRDVDNYYGDTGSPLYNPLNLNQAIDLKTYTLGSGILSIGQAYMWRMRYRDQNVRWSDWSDTLQFTVTVTGMEESADQTCAAAYPNPSDGNVTLSFNATEGQHLVVVTDITGKQIRLLHNGILHNGNRQILWDGKDDAGNKAAPGIYICNIRSLDYNRNLKLVIRQ
jgi:acid phosphatase type 7